MAKKKSIYAEQCPECRAEASGLPHNSNAIPLSPVQSRPAEDTITASPSSKTMPAVEHREFTNDGVIEEKTDKDEFVVVETVPENNTFRAELSIVGMTCMACVSCITRAVEELPFVQSFDVSLLTNSATVSFEGRHHADAIVQTIEGAGFDCTLENIEQVSKPSEKRDAKGSVPDDMWRAEYAIGGMTCSACTNAVTGAIEQLPCVESVTINLISNSGTVLFEGRHNLDSITQAIEDAGFDATLDKVQQLSELNSQAPQEREVYIQVDQMYCHHCPPKIMATLRHVYGDSLEIEKELTEKDPILKIKYTPRPPEFTIRHIVTSINSIDPTFGVSIYHPPTIEDRSRETLARERRNIFFRLALAVTAAIPAFIIGVVCMSIMMQSSSIRMFMMHPMWVGNVSRAEWALFILTTPIYFFAADIFHRKAIKEVRALWRRGSKTPIIQRFTRFGSMNMLMSLGTTVAYFSSIAELAIQATRKPTHAVSMDPTGMDHAHMSPHHMDDADFGPSESHNYFDSVIFLTMFLLLGRSIEAYTKQKTGDAVTALGQLRPTEAILVEETDVAGRKLSVDLLEVGDVVLIPHGASPPFDGIIVDGSAKFNESSLTGESRLVDKNIGDKVYSGTVNKTGPISIRLTSISGSSMLDQIIKIVREGQTKRAPVERAADMITSHFVPFVVLIGILTWATWLGLGLGHRLPGHWVQGHPGGWPLWALRFAISVFVIACPCGIGLAAPTALFVGGGLAAKNGILAKGGGEAFQEASSLDCIVFDKTGTLTDGGEPSVVDYCRVTDDDESEFLSMVQRLEENSSHPIAKAMVNFCSARSDHSHVANLVEEIPGKGLKGNFRIGDQGDGPVDVELLVGNENLMKENSVFIEGKSAAKLQEWKQSGNSVVLVALRAGTHAENQWQLTAIFAIADALRKEAKYTVNALQARGIAVWMLSGDNPTTAQAVGEMVGIPKEQIIAGVLPDQKAEKIQHLQQTLPAPKGKKRALVAMVGDGINDSPALTTADVGIAIGSGSDVAISSAEFILISSDLRAIITLIDLSRTVFRRVLFNFGWALVYNIIAMPVAAGVFFPIISSGHHVRLDPVWASLAMALSSVSVICSSLLLRSRLPFVGFRAQRQDSKE
jgi:heavy metal translocating P-type ATPase